MSSSEEFDSDFLFKIVVIGDSDVGKTNIVDRYCNDRFSEDTKNTIGVDFTIHTVIINGEKIKVQFWDTAGQEQFRSMSSAYYKNAHGAIIVYDITDQDSFNNVFTWFKEVNTYSDTIPKLLLLGNKLDLDDEREVNVELGEDFANNRDMMFEEVSAKENEDKGLNKTIDSYLEKLLDSFDAEFRENCEEEMRIRRDTISIARINARKKNARKGCCI